MEFAEYLLRTALSLLIVVGAIALILPIFLRRVTGFRFTNKGGSFEVRKIHPVGRNVYIVELEVKGKTLLLCVSEKNAEVIYREDGNNDTDSPDYHNSGSGTTTTSHRDKGR